MYATHLTQQSAGRSRKFAAMVGAAFALVIAAANVDTAAASESFPDNITVSGAAKCDSYGTAYSISVMSSPTNPSYWYPYPMTSYVALRLVNTSTTPYTTVWDTRYIEFTGLAYWKLASPGTGRFIVQAGYGRVVGGVFWKSTSWETIGVLNYPSWSKFCY